MHKRHTPFGYEKGFQHGSCQGDSGNIDGGGRNLSQRPRLERRVSCFGGVTRLVGLATQPSMPRTVSTRTGHWSCKKKLAKFIGL